MAIGGDIPAVIYEAASAVLSPPDNPLKVTRKGGIAGKKRGKYNKDSRVTRWRHRKARLEAGHPDPDDIPADSANPPATSHDRPRSDTIEAANLPPAESDAKAETQSADVVVDLRLMLAQVRNSRSKAGSLSPYEYLRLLSVERYIEWTEDGNTSAVDASRRVAEILWEHAGADRRAVSTTLDNKAKSIRQWADEYRSTGILTEHSQGGHVKKASALAQQDIAIAAQKRLAKMKKPAPRALRDVLLSTIFPNFGVEDLRISENTCRIYMEKWGWKSGKQGEWIPKRKMAFQESDDDNTGSDETAVIDHTNRQTTSPDKTPSWNAPVPIPLRQTPSFSSTQLMNGAVSASLSDIQTSPPPASSPSTIYTESSLAKNTQPQFFFQPQLAPWQSQPSFPSDNRNLCQSYNPSEPPDPSFSAASPYAQAVNPSYPPNRAYPNANTLDYLFPATAQTMGLRPVFNGAPTMSFVPPPSQLGFFAHDVSYPSQSHRSAESQQSDHSRAESQNDFYPHGGM